MRRESAVCASGCLVGLAFLAAVGVARAEPPALAFRYVPAEVVLGPDLGLVRGIASTRDGGFVVVSEQYVSFGVARSVLRRFDAAWHEVFRRELDALACQGGRLMVTGVRFTPHAGITLVGRVETGHAIDGSAVGDLWVARLSGAGELVWQRLVGAPNGDESAFDTLEVHPDGSVALAFAQGAGRFAEGAEARSYVAVLDADGELRAMHRLEGVDAMMAEVAFDAAGRVVVAADDVSVAQRHSTRLVVIDREGSLARSSVLDFGDAYGAFAIDVHDEATVLLVNERTSYGVWESSATSLTRTATLRSTATSHEPVRGTRASWVAESNLGDRLWGSIFRVVGGEPRTRARFSLPPDLRSHLCSWRGMCRFRADVREFTLLSDGSLVAVVSAEAARRPGHPLGSDRPSEYRAILRLRPVAMAGRPR